MTGADLAKARAFAKVIDENGGVPIGKAAEWILVLASTVERQASQIVVLERAEQAAMADAKRMEEERDAALLALAHILATADKATTRETAR